mmetsp:Transcript_4274/g.8282  ORF Transcript_4274/g.8282 Transcript_4274/m.8282 type:complete len:306 (-) Transcript_4274:56-973(-)
MLVHVAMNEDLTCTYKKGEISALAIDGVIQVQIKSDQSTDPPPFALKLYDPHQHIASADCTAEISTVIPSKPSSPRSSNSSSASPPHNTGVSPPSSPSSSPSHSFRIQVPWTDRYHPAVRYRCTPALRPVPIRVQSRVRVNASGTCRVALQVSSNPANGADLTDLTVSTFVPPEVEGATLRTSPAGGVWNAARRNVLWCISRLGVGEKFQLQAQFEMGDAWRRSVGAGEGKHSTEKQEQYTLPHFPVLVRCHCMHEQLSDLEMEVDEIESEEESGNTGAGFSSSPQAPCLAMKLARRFRISHREK